jgi:hypothetical protein
LLRKILFFEGLNFKKNTFKVPACFYKTLTNSGEFTGSRIRMSNSGGTSKRIGSLNSALKRRQPIICLRLRKVIPKPASIFYLFFTITSGFWNNLKNRRRLLECRKNHFE